MDLLVIYENQTLLTLTKSSMKIWDLNDLFKTKESRTVFNIKPGYRAVETSSLVGSKQFKKKIYPRGKSLSLFYFISANELVTAGIVSEGSAIFIKSYFINKFHITI